MMTRILAAALALALCALALQSVRVQRAQSALDAARLELVASHAETAGQLDRAGDAMLAASTVVARLRTALEECAGARLVDQKKSAAALAAANTSRADIARRYESLRAAQGTTLAGDCRAWADAPTCGLAIGGAP